MQDIPKESDWGDYRSGRDSICAYRAYFGKSNSDMQQGFYNCVIERFDELKYVPLSVFEYYIIGARDYILKNNFPSFEAADAVCCFISLVQFWIEKSPDFMAKIKSEVCPVLTMILNYQDKYDVNPEIYGVLRQEYSVVVDFYDI